MFPGMGGMNPKQMQQIMRQMGIKSTELECTKVVVHKSDGTLLTVEPAQVTVVEMQGARSLQVAGEFSEGGAGGAPAVDPGADDAKTVMEHARVSREVAQKALEEAKGDIAEAIMIAEEQKD